MNFTFSEDQLLFQQTLREFLQKECTPARIREWWAAKGTVSTPDQSASSNPNIGGELWSQLAALGFTGITVPEAHGGLGLNEVDCVLLAEECGYAALPEPLVHTALVAAPLLAAIGGPLAAEWLPRIAAGEAKVSVGLEENLLVEDADEASLLLMERDGRLYAIPPADANLRINPSIDPSRRLFAVEFKPSAATLVNGGAGDAANAAPAADDAAADTQTIINAAFNRGALGAAAQCLGLARRMLDMSVQYAGERQQFGKPIGSFQAVKHHLANVAVRVEYAKAPVYRAAWSLSQHHPAAPLHASQAKLAAGNAAMLAAQNAIQVHGALGYTWEADLHLFMKKAWSLTHAYGTPPHHKHRLAAAILTPATPLGPGTTFPPL